MADAARTGTLGDRLRGVTIEGRFRITECIGRGNTSVVFGAIDVSTGYPVAVKVIDPGRYQEQRIREGFENELMLLDELADVPEVISVFAASRPRVPQHDAASDVAYSVMELAHTSAESALVSGGLDWPGRVEVAVGVCRAVLAMAERGIVHRDLKLDNVLLFEGRPKLIDFGRSGTVRRADPESLVDKYGDPRYWPPEFVWNQLRAEPEQQFRAELFGLGQLLVELATGVALSALLLGAPEPLRRAHVRTGQRACDSLRNVMPLLAGNTHFCVDCAAEMVPSAVRESFRAVVARLVSPDPASRVRVSAIDELHRVLADFARMQIQLGRPSPIDCALAQQLPCARFPGRAPGYARAALQCHRRWPHSRPALARAAQALQSAGLSAEAAPLAYKLLERSQRTDCRLYRLVAHSALSNRSTTNCESRR